MKFRRDVKEGFPSQKALDSFDAMKAKYVFRTDLDGSVILTADGSGRYNIQSLKSELTVAVPE